MFSWRARERQVCGLEGKDHDTRDVKWNCRLQKNPLLGDMHPLTTSAVPTTVIIYRRSSNFRLLRTQTF